MKKIRRILRIIIVLAMVYIIANAISICRYGKIDEKCNADVTIVLGAATYDGKVSPVYQERINHAIDLYFNGYVKKIIMNENYMKTAIIVSDPLHMKRSMLLAKDMGIVAYTSPTPTTKYISIKTKLPFLSRELFFYIGYRIYRVFFM